MRLFLILQTNLDLITADKQILNKYQTNIKLICKTYIEQTSMNNPQILQTELNQITDNQQMSNYLNSIIRFFTTRTWSIFGVFAETKFKLK